MKTLKEWRENQETDNMYVSTLKSQIHRVLDWMDSNQLSKTQHSAYEFLQKALANVDEDNDGFGTA